MIKAKQISYIKGHIAEIYTMCFLLLKGYRIYKRRFSNPLGEIDLIIGKGNSIVFCEIKYRKNYNIGLYAISGIQKKRIINGAKLYIARNSQYIGMNYRFDYIVVCGLKIHHFQNAWQK